MPTYNRAPDYLWLVEEAIESFLLQDHTDSKLLICNDTPGQKLVYDGDSRVEVLNVPQRFPTLSAKLQWMIDQTPDDGLLTRWDDDDISLPWRLAYSYVALTGGGLDEWRPTNHFYVPKFSSTIIEQNGVGNTHNMSLWKKRVLGGFPDGKYPQDRSGDEDQAFNILLKSTRFRWKKTRLPHEEVFYLYRWGVSPAHLSGRKCDDNTSWDWIGAREIVAGEFALRPHWTKEWTTAVSTG